MPAKAVIEDTSVAISGDVVVVEGPRVIVSAPGVAKPVAVRYAWRDDAEPNLMNKAGLPARPFRTDGPKTVE